jgi:hypothetical protein
MPHVPRPRGPLVIVNWEPMLHLASASTPGPRYQETATTFTQCGQWVTGFVDDNPTVVVTCLSCLGAR